MDKQNVPLKTQRVAQDWEVIGQGGMVYKPCQIGEWWVMPADQYTGKIPDDIMKKWDNFKALGIPVQGYLIADDMRQVLYKREKEAEDRRRLRMEQLGKAAKITGKVLLTTGKVLGKIAVGVAVVTGIVLITALRFDPILIAVLPDGRWICLGAWWD